MYPENGNYLKVFCSDVRHIVYIAVEFLNAAAISDADVIRCVLLVLLLLACSAAPRAAKLIPD